MEPKKGILTTEFYSQIAGVGVMLMNKGFGWNLDPVEIGSMFAMIMTYIAARTWAKKAK